MLTVTPPCSAKVSTRSCRGRPRAVDPPRGRGKARFHLPIWRGFTYNHPCLCNNRKEVIQCLIVSTRGRRVRWPGSSPLSRFAPPDPPFLRSEAGTRFDNGRAAREGSPSLLTPVAFILRQDAT